LGLTGLHFPDVIAHIETAPSAHDFEPSSRSVTLHAYQVTNEDGRSAMTGLGLVHKLPRSGWSRKWKHPPLRVLLYDSQL
jgi:hypothetical protein